MESYSVETKPLWTLSACYNDYRNSQTQVVLDMGIVLRGEIVVRRNRQYRQVQACSTLRILGLLSLCSPSSLDNRQLHVPRTKMG